MKNHDDNAPGVSTAPQWQKTKQKRENSTNIIHSPKPISLPTIFSRWTNIIILIWGWNRHVPLFCPETKRTNGSSIGAMLMLSQVNRFSVMLRFIDFAWSATEWQMRLFKQISLTVFSIVYWIRARLPHRVGWLPIDMAFFLLYGLLCYTLSFHFVYVSYLVWYVKNAKWLCVYVCSVSQRYILY